MTENLIRYGNRETCKISYDQKYKDMAYFTFQSLEETGIVEHFFSTRKGGVSRDYLSSLNFSYSQGDRKENVDENYKRAAAHMGMTSNDIVCSQQTHTTNVRKVTAADKGKGVVCERDYTDVDGLITNEQGIILATFYADCVPLFIVDPVNRAIGLSHSGWRGTVGKMGKVTLEKMAAEYGTKPEFVKIAIAPSICQTCYEVSEEVALAFEEAFVRDDEKAAQYMSRYQMDASQKEIEDCLLYQKENGKYQLNLWYANFRVFRDAGVPDENIEVTDVCTCCNPELLFSHRASQGRRGNLGAFLMLK
ncbi:MAG: peptidoglycan editing factor PgeF [Lachnospiraceae bacterium]|nr:peptidoglycan editing factor PgeF [Lachnospiraceae bacterium]